MLVKKWAPVVRFHKNEKWNPSTVEFFLQHTNLVDGSSCETPLIKKLTPSNLPTCTTECRLETKEKLTDADTSDLKLFFGEPAKKATTYVLWKKSENELQVKYSWFFPYNRGKVICLGVLQPVCPCAPFLAASCGCPLVQQCLGLEQTFGNHVGDWEFITITFDAACLEPKSIDLIAHGMSAFYNYDGSSFIHENGDKITFQGTHPVAYIALGSHGLRANPGRFVYLRYLEDRELVDETSDGGAELITENNLRITQVQNPYTGEDSFYNFKGRWGNSKAGCVPIIERLTDECILSSAPTVARL